MKLYKLKNLDELIKAIDMGMDIEIFIYGIRYNISWRNYKPFICTCPDGDAIFFESVEDLMSTYEVKGKPLKEIWQDFEIYSM